MPEIKLAGTTGSNGWYKSNVEVTITNTNGTGELHYILTGTTNKEETTTEDASVNLTISSAGLTKVIAWVEDGSGNTSEHNYENVKIDTSGPLIPTLTVISGTKTLEETNWYTSDVTVEMSSSDSNSGIYGYIYTIKKSTDGGQTFTETVASEVQVQGQTKELKIATDGIYKIIVKAIDRAGNESEEASITIYKDSEGPASFVPYARSVTDTNITIMVNTEDELSGIAYYEYYIKKDSDTEYTKYTDTSSTFLYTEGRAKTSYTIYVIAYDNAGNKTTGNKISAETINLEIAVTAETIEQTEDSVTIDVTATNEGGEIAYEDLTYTFTITDSNGEDVTEDLTIIDNEDGTFTIEDLTPGEKYIVEIEVEDKNGNTGEGSIEVTTTVPDATSENITFAQDPSSWTNKDVTVTATTTTGFAVQISSDGTTWEGGTSKSAQITIAANGKIYARLYNGSTAGGYITYTVTNIDKVEPIATPKSSTTQSVSFTGTDSLSGICAYAVTTSYADEPDLWTATTATTSLGEKTVEGLLQGKTYYIWVKDQAGNTNSTTVETTAITTGEIEDVEVTQESLVGKYVKYTPDSSNTYSLVTNSATYTGTTENDTDFTTDTSLNWQIWSMTDDTLTLIADNVQSTGGYSNSGELYLSGATGYNNAVYLMNSICNTLYSNSSLGATARSINIQDIEEVLNWDTWAPTDYYITKDNTAYYTYNMKTTYKYSDSNYRYYPVLWLEEDFSNIDGTKIEASYTYDNGTLTYTGNGLRRNEQTSLIPDSTGTYEQANSYIDVTETYWLKGMSESNFEDSKYYSLIFQDSSKSNITYWLASRYTYVYEYDSFATFGIQRIADGYVRGYGVYMSYNSSSAYSHLNIRPVVEIPLDNLTLDTWSTTGDSVSQAYTLVAKTEENKVTTGTIATSAQVEFSEVTWDSELASVTITSTDSNYYIQYQISSDGTYSDDDWDTSDSKGTVELTDIAVNSTIYVRLYDGTNYGGYGSLNVIDYVGPTVTIETSDILATSVTVTVNSAEDYQSGMPDTPTYIYQYRKDGSTTWYTAEETTSTSHTITGLDADTSYDIRVRVADNGGTYGAGKSRITTDTLVGYYVSYTPDSGNSYTLAQGSTYTGTTDNDTDFTTDTSLNWQIWSIDDDTLTLIADDISNSGGYYDSDNGYWVLHLYGALGYNNGVYLLNDICETLYSSSSVNETGVQATARSLNIQDIEEVLNWDKWAPTDSYLYADPSTTEKYYTYNTSTTYNYTSPYIYYPVLWAKEDFSNIDGNKIEASYTYNSETGELTYTSTGNGLRRSDRASLTTETYSEAKSYIEVTRTLWSETLTSEYYKDSKYLNLVNCEKNYWLASRFVDPNPSGKAAFGLDRVYGDNSPTIGPGTMFASNAGSDGLDESMSIRPVVEIPLSSLELDTTNYTGLSTDKFEIVKK